MTTSEAIATLEQLAPALAGRLELRLAAAADRGSSSGDWAGYAELELELRRRAGELVRRASSRRRREVYARRGQ